MYGAGPSPPQLPLPDEVWSPGTDPDALAVPADVGLAGYRDFVLVARGGDSVVYRARQAATDRLVAVKVLAVATEPEEGRVSANRFQRELEITVRLGRAHPNIVTVLDTQLTSAGQPCIVMEYYELGSLHDQLRNRG